MLTSRIAVSKPIPIVQYYDLSLKKVAISYSLIFPVLDPVTMNTLFFKFITGFLIPATYLAYAFQLKEIVTITIATYIICKNKTA